jgi:oligoribonuclease
MSPLTTRERKVLWVDSETTGLNFRKGEGAILEICGVVTDEKIEIVDEYHGVIHVPEEQLRWQMNQWCWTNHAKSGLLDEVRSSTLTLEQAEAGMIDLVKRNFREKVVIGGSSIHFDRNFINEHMPALASCFTHQMIDVTSLMLAYRVVYGYEPKRENVAHRAPGDIRQSIGFFKNTMMLSPLKVEQLLKEEP